MVELVGKEEDQVMLMTNMKDGQLAEIVGDSIYKGQIIHYRAPFEECEDYLWQSIGKSNGMSWSRKEKDMNIKVRILKDGEMLVVKENQ